MNKPSAEDVRLLDTLRQAGREAVERKRRLGQYAVVWRGGHPAFIGPNPPKPGQHHPAASSVHQRVSGIREDGPDEPSDRRARHRMSGRYNMGGRDATEPGSHGEVLRNKPGDTHRADMEEATVPPARLRDG